MAMLERNLGGKTPQPLVYKLEERMEVAKVIPGLTMGAEEQRDGMGWQHRALCRFLLKICRN